MMNMGLWHIGLAISPSSADSSNSRFGSTCYAGVQYDNSGEEYKRSNTGTWQGTSRGAWLDGGSVGGVWIERTINSGSLNTDALAVRLNLGTQRNFGLNRATPGTDTCNITFDFYNAASGGDLLDSVTFDISAQYII